MIDVKKLRELAQRVIEAMDKADNGAFGDALFQFRAATHPETILALCDRLEAAEKDAERYRWLRDNAQPSYLMMATINESAPSLCRRELLTIDAQSWEALDQHIDAALAQRQEGS